MNEKGYNLLIKFLVGDTLTDIYNTIVMSLKMFMMKC